MLKKNAYHIEKKILDQKGNPEMVTFKKYSNYSVSRAKELLIQNFEIRKT